MIFVDLRRHHCHRRPKLSPAGRCPVSKYQVVNSASTLAQQLNRCCVINETVTLEIISPTPSERLESILYRQRMINLKNILPHVLKWHLHKSHVEMQYPCVSRFLVREPRVRTKYAMALYKNDTHSHSHSHKYIAHAHILSHIYKRGWINTRT